MSLFELALTKPLLSYGDKVSNVERQVQGRIVPPSKCSLGAEAAFYLRAFHAIACLPGPLNGKCGIQMSAQARLQSNDTAKWWPCSFVETDVERCLLGHQNSTAPTPQTPPPQEALVPGSPEPYDAGNLVSSSFTPATILGASRTSLQLPQYERSECTFSSERAS